MIQNNVKINYVNVRLYDSLIFKALLLLIIFLVFLKEKLYKKNVMYNEYDLLILG